MRKYQLIAIFSLFLLIGGCQGYDQKGSVRVMTLNIRYDNPGDGMNSWKLRKDLVKDAVMKVLPDVIGFQEVLFHQLTDLDTLLPHFDYVGVGRDDGEKDGEFSPIFYKMNRLTLLEWGTFWLSEEPDSAGSVGWDAALPRIANWARFHDKHIRRDFLFINTHFDHQGDTARIESAGLILRFVEARQDSLPVLLTGDLNFTPGSPGYSTLTSGNLLKDAFISSITGNRGLSGTFNGFDKDVQDPPRIDYIFADNSWRVYEHYIEDFRKEDILISDHFPVYSILGIKRDTR